MSRTILPRNYSIESAGTLWGVVRSTVYLLIERHEIPFTKIGNRKVLDGPTVRSVKRLRDRDARILAAAG